MNPLKQKAYTGVSLIAVFLATLATGMLLHMKSHGIVTDHHQLLKTLHWLFGFGMVGLSILHARQFWKSFLGAMHKESFQASMTCAIIAFMGAATITGLIKLFSPVRIPHIGLWHYWLGLMMTFSVAWHLWRGIPMLVKMLRAIGKVS